jgi:ABC-type bacteriocin/lantibiotic exporter with double-glycine peptidase domain
MLVRILAFMGSVVASGGRAIIDMRGINDLNEILAKQKRKYESSNKRIISSIVEINIKCLYCGYVKNNPILNNINAKLVAGRSYALNGKSGSGKSTFCDVLLGMLDPISGEILIGENTYTMVDLTSLRRKIVLVEQQTRIFSGSLEDNITLGLKASKNDLQIAINCAGLTEFIQSLENGLATQLDYQGANLSGGQRQRIGIARAILRKPDVLILDEATSALDIHTRNQIIGNIKEMFCEKIILFISHDSYITSSVDEVWHIKDGILAVEKNSHIYVL